MDKPLPNDGPGWFSQCTSGGCGAKIGPADLVGLLSSLPKKADPNLLVGYDGADDAAVYLLNQDQALIFTTDFFPPMVDDPKLFGQAAATNALSDIYAMGGVPLMALNLVCFPQRLDSAILGQILLGGYEKVLEAGAVIGGGHSIYDHEPKYGLAVTGLADPKKIWTNKGAEPGQVIILTKALGVGLVLSAKRAGLISDEEFLTVSASITRLNRYAAEKLKKFSVSAVTDVTGFGLAGHLAEMAGDDLTMVLDYDSLPILPGAFRCASEFLSTVGGQRNRSQLAGRVDLSALNSAQEEIIYDPQTSGGLAICVPASEAQAVLEAIRYADPVAAIIGQVEPRIKDLSVWVL
ncbi:MAG: selenide, water dikinase SelD [Deltaproteobacteria bacterium]|jgi:selenide,water dikinase|nr:selenide, water dikinase SelD [Deltaproteobacteria bacterium]